MSVVPPRLTHNRSWIWIVGLLLFISFIAVWRLDEGIWTDEERTLYYIGASPQYDDTNFAESWGRLAENYWQSPGYYLLLKAWALAAGQTIFALRVMSLLLALLAIALLYRLTVYYFDRTLALYATLLMSVNAFYVNFTHDMRTYSLLVVLALLLLWLYEWVKRSAKAQGWQYGLMALVVAALVYAHYFAVFFVFAVFAYHLLFERRNLNLVWLIVAHGVAVILFLPWLGVLYTGLQVSVTDPRQADNYSAIGGASETLRYFGNGSIALVLLLLAVGAAGAFANPRGRYLWFLLVVIYSTVWFVTRFFQIFTQVRYIIFVFPLLAMLAAVGVERLARRGIPVAVVFGVWSVVFVGSLFSVREQDRMQPWAIPPFPQLEEQMDAHLHEDDALLWLTAPLVRNIETDMLRVYLYPHNGLNSRVVADTFATTDEYYASLIAEGVEDADILWMTHDPTNWTWRLGEVNRQLEEDLGFQYCGSLTEKNNLQVDLYARDVPFDSSYNFEVSAQDTLQVGVLRDAYTASREVFALLGWRGAPVTANVSVAVHLEDGAENFLGSVDNGVETTRFRCALVRFDVAELEQRPYTARLVVYNWQTGERYSATTGDGTVERPIIGTVGQPSD